MNDEKTKEELQDGDVFGYVAEAESASLNAPKAVAWQATRRSRS